MPSQQRHVATLRELLAEYEESLPRDLRHGDLPEQLRRIESDYAQPGAAFVIYETGEAAGCVALSAGNDATGIVKRLYVRPAFRRKGIAQALMAALIGYARSAGFGRLALDTHREILPSAYRLYVSLGFTECAAVGQVQYDCPTYMELTLAKR